MRSIDNKFYHSKEWAACRTSYINEHPLCERCLKQGLIVPAEIVHHKIHLTEENVKDPAIAFGKDNLESVCKTCHNQEHFGYYQLKRWKFIDGELQVEEDS